MIDTHSADCSCSYCAGDDKLHFGLNIPRDWFHPVSWYVIKYWHNRYIRWTNNWMRFFKRK